VKIVPDPKKRDTNLAKHGFDLDDLDEEFFAAAVVFPVKAGQLMAVGEYDGIVISVVFAPLGTEAIAPISMRPASRKERKLWPKRSSPPAVR
jgi:uncharacterized DUF497 family protein